MTYRKQLGRYAVLILVLVTLAAGTTTASRWLPWSPVNTCLFCGGSTTVAPASTEAPATLAATSGTLATRLGHSVEHPQVDLVPSAIAPPAVANRADTAADHSNASTDGWQPWAHASAHLSGGGDASILLSGFARLASASIGGGGSTVRHSPAAPAPTPALESTDHREDPAPVSAAPAPVANSTTHPAPSTVTLPPAAGGSTVQAPVLASTTATTTVAAAVGPAPTDAFQQHEAPAPTPFVPPAPIGRLDANDPPGTLPTEGPSSPTPEPASLMLLATGAALVFGELRRRRTM